jgi:hypothetical protein
MSYPKDDHGEDRLCTKQRHYFPKGNDGDCQCGLVNECRIPQRQDDGIQPEQKDNRKSPSHS